MKNNSSLEDGGLGLTLSTTRIVSITGLEVGKQLVFNYFINTPFTATIGLSSHTGYEDEVASTVTNRTEGLVSGSLVCFATASTVELTFNEAIDGEYLFTAYQA